MKKMVAMVAFATAVMIGASAMAAPVDIYVVQLGTPSAPSGSWEIRAAASVDTGNISLEVFGFSGRTLAALPQISALDSQFVGGVGGATVQITSLAGQDLIPIGGGVITLATLTGGAAALADTSGCTGEPSVVGGFLAPCAGINSGDNAFGFTAVNQALDTPLEYSLTVVPVAAPVPEPATMVLLGLGLAALATVRRSA